MAPCKGCTHKQHLGPLAGRCGSWALWGCRGALGSPALRLGLRQGQNPQRQSSRRGALWCSLSAFPSCCCCDLDLGLVGQPP